MKKIFPIVLAAIVITSFVYWKSQAVKQQEEITPQPIVEQKQEKPLAEKVLLDVPFISQAPFGNWNDPRQQDGCEETSVYMASLWTKGEELVSKQAGLEEILKLSSLSEELFDTYIDTSAKDTARLFKEYTGLDTAEVKYDLTVDEIRKELNEGKLIIAPADGRKLNNPNFTQPGPDRHMLVIRGYDHVRGVFITNDPGTRKGELYEYTYDVAMNAMLDYPTGDHITPTFKNRNSIIIVSKE